MLHKDIYICCMENCNILYVAVILYVRMWIEIKTKNLLQRASCRHPLCEDVDWNRMVIHNIGMGFCHPPCEDVDWNIQWHMIGAAFVVSASVWGWGRFADYFHIKSIQKDTRLVDSIIMLIQQILVRLFWTSKKARRYSQCYPDISQSRRCSLWNQRIVQRDYCIFRCTVLRAEPHLDCSARKLN